MDQRPSSPPADDDPEEALRAARARFESAFHERSDSIARLVDTIAQLGSAGPIDTLQQIAHRMSGLAGMIGLPEVSAAAGRLEAILTAVADHGFDAEAARQAVRDLRDGFARGMAAPPPMWAGAPVAAAAATILLFEDDLDQQRLVMSALRAVGHRVVACADGHDVLAVARREQPSLVLLDVHLPGADGYTICRVLKADAAFAAVPVLFLTTQASLDDRVLGLTLGADDYLAKPVDIRELQLRVDVLLRRAAATHGAAAEAQTPEVVGYEAFLLAARGELTRHPGVVAMVRANAEHLGAVGTAVAEDVRRRDLIGRYDQRHLVLYLPDIGAAAAAQRLRGIIERLTTDAGVPDVRAGLAAVGAPGVPIETLLAEADEALAEARYLGQSVAIRGAAPPEGRAIPQPASRTAVLAEDDPDVMRIVDAHLRHAGFRTVLAFDGERALEAVRTEAPDVLVLDLMMPRLTGFDVLQRLRTLDVRPRVVVVSARGREGDITRAFELGADDYLTKPFSPPELLARITRLLR